MKRNSKVDDQGGGSELFFVTNQKLFCVLFLLLYQAANGRKFLGCSPVQRNFSSGDDDDSDMTSDEVANLFGIRYNLMLSIVVSAYFFFTAAIERIVLISKWSDLIVCLFQN